MTVYKIPDRNFSGIQYEKLRLVVDQKFNVVHDELSDCYYNGKPFRTFGVLDKVTFDKLHGLIFALREVALEAENNAATVEDKVLPNTDAIAQAKELITDLRKEKLELTI